MRKLRITIAEDHALVREGLKLLINRQPDMEVVGEAEDGRTAVALAKQLRPDLLVVDVGMPGWNGVLVTQRVRKEHPDTPVLVLTIYQDRAYVRQLMVAGAGGYVLKLTKPTEFLQAVRTVAAGGMYVDPHVARMASGKDLTPSIAAGGVIRPILTSRDTELMQLVARGHSNKEVADLLGVTVKTVETYKARVMEKLGFRSRVQLIQFALQQGWLSAADAV